MWGVSPPRLAPRAPLMGGVRPQPTRKGGCRASRMRAGAMKSCVRLGGYLPPFPLGPPSPRVRFHSGERGAGGMGGAGGRGAVRWGRGGREGTPREQDASRRWPGVTGAGTAPEAPRGPGVHARRGGPPRGGAEPPQGAEPGGGWGGGRMPPPSERGACGRHASGGGTRHAGGRSPGAPPQRGGGCGGVPHSSGASGSAASLEFTTHVACSMGVCTCGEPRHRSMRACRILRHRSTWARSFSAALSPPAARIRRSSVVPS